MLSVAGGSTHLFFFLRPDEPWRNPRARCLHRHSHCSVHSQVEHHTTRDHPIFCDLVGAPSFAHEEVYLDFLVLYYLCLFVELRNQNGDSMRNFTIKSKYQVSNIFRSLFEKI
jgi:hypothetical protein